MQREGTEPDTDEHDSEVEEDGVTVSLSPPSNDLDQTPAWLATVALLAGEHVVPFKSVTFITRRRTSLPMLVATYMPDTSVRALTDLPDSAAFLRRCAVEAGRDNLNVADDPALADTEQRADLVVLDGVMDTLAPGQRTLLAERTVNSLRPGGLAAVAYRTTVGWSELMPVIALLRHLVSRDPRPPADVVADGLELLAELRDRGAAYLVARPAVAAWLDELSVTPTDRIVADYLTTEIVPTSFAAIHALLTPLGLTHVSSAHRDAFALELPGTCSQVVEQAADPLARSSLDDLSVRRARRVDLFRLGRDPISAEERTAALAATRILPLEHPGPPDASGASAVDSTSGAPTVAELGADMAEAEAELRRRLADGTAYPVPPGAEVATTAELVAAVLAEGDRS